MKLDFVEIFLTKSQSLVPIANTLYQKRGQKLSEDNRRLNWLYDRWAIISLTIAMTSVKGIIRPHYS